MEEPVIMLAPQLGWFTIICTGLAGVLLVTLMIRSPGFTCNVGFWKPSGVISKTAFCRPKKTDALCERNFSQDQVDVRDSEIQFPPLIFQLSSPSHPSQETRRMGPKFQFFLFYALPAACLASLSSLLAP